MTANLLTSIDLQGYKSIRNLQQLQLTPLNILIGANGAGKSNFISFFKLLNWMTFAPELQYHISRVGGANSLLHDGASVTPQMNARLVFKTQAGLNEYEARLFHAANDTLIFADEQIRFQRSGNINTANWITFRAGHRETNLRNKMNEGNPTAKVLFELLRRCVVYQFHNTSETARIKQRWSVNDAVPLKDDGANLAPFLFRLREQKPLYYERIISTIHQIAPFFSDFVLEPSYDTLLLQWRERGTDRCLGLIKFLMVRFELWR